MNYVVLQNCTLWVLENERWIKKFYQVNDIISIPIQDLELAIELEYIQLIQE